MRIRWLGKTGLQVSEICFGTGSFGGVGSFKHTGTLNQAEANRVVDIALDAGVNFFNTAEVYSQGVAEEMLGKALGARRKDVIVITKISYHVKPGQNTAGLSRKHVVEACEASLKRLGTDYIDIYEAHGLDPRTEHEITMSALNDLVHQGKARYIGCSNYAAWNLMKGLSISERNGWEKFMTLEAMYSLACRWLELELMPACLDQGVPILAYSPLHAGLLSGKYRRDQPWPEGTRVATQPDAAEKWPFEKEKLFGIVDELTRIAQAHQGTVSQAAINWVLQRPGVCSAIIGVRTPAQLEDNLGAMNWRLTEEEMAKLDAMTEPVRENPYIDRLMKPSGDWISYTKA
jgi:aryl-alcohol dehydrogenase-like predicted oxidoreductase